MLACYVLIVVAVVVVEQESLRLGVVFRNWFFVCFVFRVFWGFCGWVLEALCSPAQMRMQKGPALGAPGNACGEIGFLCLAFSRAVNFIENYCENEGFSEK